jgi:GNAT superfamily N-acetyltransferase
VRIVRAGQADHDDAFAIFEEYYDAIAVLVRDDYDALREYLSDPAGLWLARDAARVIGCIALRPLPAIEGACEIKRLYIRGEYRGKGIADALLETLHRAAVEQGFEWSYLDTKDDLLPAIRFYERHGYARCERYNDNPQATIFMRRRLWAWG